MHTTVFEMDYKSGKLVPAKNAELQIGQIVWLNGYGQSEHGHDRKAIFDISESYSGKMYHLVNLDKVTHTERHEAYSIKPASEIFGIGTYYNDGDTATPEEIAEALTKAKEFEKQQNEIKEQKEKEAEIIKEKGKKIFEENKPATAQAVIIANHNRDESDLMSDYFGYSTERTVILAFSDHTRDLFSEMRKACLNTDIKEIRELAESPKEYEHREKYSMGSGYYLGKSKYDGWTVKKTNLSYSPTQFYHAAGFENGFFAFKKQATKEIETVGNKTIRTNTEKNGIEIIFPNKPNAETLNKLKANGWRWSNFNKLWYNKNTPENYEFAITI